MILINGIQQIKSHFKWKKGLFLLFFVPLSVSGAGFTLTKRPLITRIDMPVLHSNQIWSIAQSKSGIMYFSTSLGLLEYDGSHWRQFRDSIFMSFRALYWKGDKLWAGGYETLGNISYDSKEEMVCHFPVNIDTGTVWRIFPVGGNLFFATTTHLYRYTDNSLEEWEAQFYPIVLDDQLIYATFNALWTIKGGGGDSSQNSNYTGASTW